MRHQITKLFILGAFLFLGMTADIFAAGGNLDTSFNGTGKSVFNIESSLTTGSFADIVVIGGNKYLTVGRVRLTANYEAVTLSRFNNDGSPDNSFGSGGRIITDLGITAGGAAIAIQSDGKILVTGVADSYPNAKAFVIRFTPDGAIDTTFGSNGVFYSVMKVSKDLSVLSDDKILIAGASDIPNSGSTQVQKLNANGSIDTTFGNNSITSSVYSFGSITDKMEIQSDGKIVISGTTFGASGLVHRFNTDGSPDTTFGTGGYRQIIGPSGTQMYMHGGVALQPDGKMVLAGYASVTSSFDFQIVLVRLNSDGSSDNTFGTQFGMIFHDLSANIDSAADVLLQGDGKIVICGSRGESAIVARFDSTGALDPSFNSVGVKSISPGPHTTKIILQGSNLITIGQYPVTVGMSNSGIFVSRIDQTGANLTYTDESIFVGKQDQARDVAIQPDGKIVTAGFSLDSSSNPVLSVARLLPNGIVDTAFGTGGRVALNDGRVQSEAYAVDIQPDGKILIAGRHSDFSIYSGSLFVVRLNADGTFDGTFGTGGKVIINLFQDLIGYDMELQPDGKIVVGGSARRWIGDGISDLDMMAARINSNGTLDSGFASNGFFEFISGTPQATQHEEARALTIQPDGKIILAGSHILRLDPNGTVDATFSATPVSTAIYTTDVKVLADGKILLGGSQSGDFALARYSNAVIDTSFGVNGNGIVTLDFGGSDIANSIYLDPNGDIVAGGSTFVGSTFRRNFALARFKSNGAPDSTFGSGGKVITDFGADAEIFGLARQSDGKIVAAGQTKSSIDRDYAVARYLSQTRPAQFDIDGDGKSDISIFRPSVGEWWWLKSSNGGNYAAQFGNSSDRIAPADFTGDGKADVTIFRPSTGEWFVLRSEDGSYYSFPFGISGDIPAPGDFDADGRADAAVFRPSNATWYIRRSSDGGTTIQQFGVNGDVPVVADYDGDGRADIAIFRPSNGQWWLSRSTAGIVAYQFGSGSDKTVQSDWTGDGKADVAFWRPSTGEWFVLRSENNSYYSFAFGLTGDLPAPGDYDGDGRTDAVVLRPSNAVWYLLQTTNGFTARQFGLTTDSPVPGAFVR